MIAAAVAHAPASSVLDLVRAVLRYARAAAARHLPTVCKVVHAHRLADEVRGDLAELVATHDWSTTVDLAQAIQTCAILVSDGGEREAIAEALIEETRPDRVLFAPR